MVINLIIAYVGVNEVAGIPAALFLQGINKTTKTDSVSIKKDNSIEINHIESKIV